MTLSYTNILEHFARLHRHDTDVSRDDAEQFCELTDFGRNEYIYEELNEKITADECFKVIQSVKRNKACGKNVLMDGRFIETFENCFGSHLKKYIVL